MKTFVLLLVALTLVFPACSRKGPVKFTNSEAARKYAKAEQYLADRAPNRAVDEAADIVMHYPDSLEATQAAILLMDKCDYIGLQQFYTLTGHRLPVNYELPRAQQIDILMVAFQRRGIFPQQK